MARTKEEVELFLINRGVELNIGGCGCCSSPWVSIRIDGELVVDEAEEYTLKMIPGKSI